ncbi:hypothetical protein B0H14DRAFT_2727164 [Mycena olivaceomarginata]|nr:hypothetical protein B0H14DRAFT_2727164 [Mycena olivaceomarginata]
MYHPDSFAQYSTRRSSPSHSNGVVWGDSHQMTLSEYPNPYDIPSAISGFSDLTTFSSSYDHVDSYSTNPSSSAPMPYYRTTPGPFFYTHLDTSEGEQYYHHHVSYASEGRDENSMQTYTKVAEYNDATALWERATAIPEFQCFDAKLRLAPNATPDLDHITLHLHPEVCISPALLSCAPPLKLHQPQPRRSIPVVSISALASMSLENVQLSVEMANHPTSPTSPPLESTLLPSRS